MTWFRRIEFHGEHKANVPKWHVEAEPGSSEKYRKFVAACGYEWSNLMGDLKISRAKAGPKGERCSKCVKAVKAVSK